MIKEFPGNNKKKALSLPEGPAVSTLGYVTTQATIRLLEDLVTYMKQPPLQCKIDIPSVVKHIDGIIENLGENDYVTLAEEKEDGTLWTPADALVSALGDVGDKDVNTAFRTGKKLLILALNEGDDRTHYDVSFIQAGMRLSECISLCSAAQIVFLKQMNFIDPE